MIKLLNISKVFKSDIFTQPFVALSNLSFEIPSHQIVGFLGANGAGKTTSIKIVMDFIRPSNGTVEFAPELGKDKKEIFKNIGFLPERPYFYPHLTGMELCYFMGELCELSRKQINERVKIWAPRFKIDFALNRELKTYSKGMLQRVGFLATILHQPKIIILDEPLSGVDPIGRKELKDVICEIHKEGMTIFFSSHIISDVEEICDSVIFMKKGELVYQGSVDKLIADNIKPNIFISYIDNGEIKKMTVQDSEQNKILSKLLTDNKKIISMEQDKPSLEDIFYNVKGQNE